jgi:signal peptidase II
VSRARAAASHAGEPLIDTPASMRRQRAAAARRPALIAGVAAAVVAADQASKTWALHHAHGQRLVWTLHLTLTFNKGIAFSQATGSTSLVTVVALVVLAALIVFARRSSGTYTAVVLGLAIGGALGNLADRLIRHNAGAVIDFIDLRWWPVFNLSDAAISIGVVLAVARGVFAPARR